MNEWELDQMGRALDALEELHDYAQALGGGERKARECGCPEARTWRKAREVLWRTREKLGLAVALRDRL
jgi:hypothetical protein